MEAIVARLLSAFEHGKLDRRQLIQSIALAATGAHVLASAEPAAAATVPAGSAGFKTAGLDHISYAVSDYKRSRDFYADLMGWEVQNDNGTSQATLKTGPHGTIIIRNARNPVNIPGGEGRPPITAVINHVSWAIEPFDTNAVKAELERRKLNPRRDQGGGQGRFDSYHVLDPDGWDLQISNTPN